ncbi:MAG TPA: hypothetical protein VJC39_02625 [Candidatus Nanoarchaeia archaeon]|nr:hypothetical protein [Candidatus Nanoarchaeia archaeon]
MPKKVKSRKSEKSKPEVKPSRHWQVVPLKSSFMVTAIVGFIISAFLIDDFNYRLAFMIVFGLMFIASFISLEKAPVME